MELIPPPTVNGIFMFFEISKAKLDNVFLLSFVAVMSRKTNSSAPSFEYNFANSTGSPASIKLRKLTPLTVLLLSISKQGIILLATILNNHFF